MKSFLDITYVCVPILWPWLHTLLIPNLIHALFSTLKPLNIPLKALGELNGSLNTFGILEILIHKGLKLVLHHK